MNQSLKALSAVIALSLPALVYAAGDMAGMSGHGKMPAQAMAGHDMAGMHGDEPMSMAGMAGDPSKASRTIAVEMNDNMRFTPDSVTAKAGETVRFYIVNKGKLTHEMMIGTTEELEAHAQMMRQMPGMVHQGANQITLNAGQRGGIVWQFAKAGTYAFACLVPGHKEAGMVGTVEVK